MFQGTVLLAFADMQFNNYTKKKKKSEDKAFSLSGTEEEVSGSHFS